MKTYEERIVLLHKRAAVLQREREGALLRLWGTSSAGLAAALICLTFRLGGSHGLPRGGLTGSALLYENAGGYVLVGVLAFLVGVAVTVAIRQRRGRNACAAEQAEKEGNDR